MIKTAKNTGKATASKATATVKKTPLKVVSGSKKEKPAIAPSKGEMVAINKPTLKEITSAENKEYIKEFSLCDKEFSKAFKDVENSSLKVAQLLYYIEVNRLYECDGYKSTADYAGQNFGVSKATVSKFINIVEKFGVDLDDKKYRFKGMRGIQEKYRAFSWSKLAIMANVDNALIDKCKPDMSYRDILTLIKADGKQQKLIADKEESFDAETTSDVETKEIPTLSTELIFEIKTESALSTFIEKLKDKDFLDSIKQDIKDGRIIHIDRIVVTNNKKVSVK